MSWRVRSALRKLAAVALALALFGGLYLMVVAPLYARFASAGEAIGEQRVLLGRLAAAVAKRTTEATAARAVTLAGGPHARGLSAAYLEGESDAVKAARLQAVLKRLAEQTGLRLASTRALPQRDQGRLRLIGMEMRLDASIGELQRLLLAFEASRPVVLTHALAIAPGRERLAADEDRLTGEVPLSVTMEVFGATPAVVMDAAPTDGEVRDDAGR